MLGQIFLTSCLVMMTSCWKIDVSEKNVALQLSLDVMLDCRNNDDNNDSPKLEKITKLRILKRSPNNHLVSLAKVEREAQRVQTSLQNVVLTGNASNRSHSFLKLQFPFATDDVIGQFVCEVEGYYSGDEVLKHVVKTEPVVITQRDATSQDVLKVILQFKEQNKTKTFNEHILFLLLQKIINRYDKDFEKMSHIHEKDFEKTNEEMKSIAQANPSQIWPAGRYALLKPKTGCPFSSTFDWLFSSARIATKPGSSNNDKKTSHLSHHTLEHVISTNRNFFNLEFCTKSVAVEGPAWPKGSYCIQHYSGSCPGGFSSGAYIEVGRYYANDIPKDVVFNMPMCDTDPKEYTDQYYCCRNDGDANTPIELPTREPFFLYRKGGTCQKVKGMAETNELIQLDTTDRDKYQSGVNHPDSSINPLKLQLCYYE